MDVPNKQERKALEELSHEPWEHAAKVGSEATIAALREKGWIEEAPMCLPGWNKVSITNAGRAALALPLPPKPKAGPRLKMVKPMLKEADMRIAKPRTR